MFNNKKNRYHGYIRGIRELLLEKGLESPEKLACATDSYVNDLMRKYYKTFLVGKNEMLLIPNEKYDEFCKLAIWVGE